jgi:predicted anti-sigma-YlaC factor YlaD
MSEPGHGPCGCDPEKIFELADGGLGHEQEPEMREHLASCPVCRELYERELDLSASLSTLENSRVLSRSVCQGVVMALPTRPARMRVLWGLLAAALLVTALVSLQLNGMEPVILAMSVLGACWDRVAGSADVARAVFVAAGPTILLVLALGALMDLLIALAVVSVSRGRRAREA